MSGDPSGRAGTPRAPARRLPWLLLGLSLALNLLFAAGVLYAWLGRAERDPTAEAAAELALTEAQRQALEELRAELAGEREEMRAAGGDVRELLIAELVKPDFDRAEIERLLRERSDQRIGYFAEVAARVHGWLQGLAPEQRQRFRELAKDRGFLRALLFRRRE